MEALFKSWTDYALANGEKPGTTRWFSQAMQRFGFDPVKHTPGENKKRGFKGVGMKPVDTSNQYQNKHEAAEEAREEARAAAAAQQGGASSATRF